MFRRIRSNRDPRDTVYSELKRELAPYFGRAKTQWHLTAGDHPRLIFGFMVVNIVLSVILSFTVFRRHGEPPQKKYAVKILAPVSDGIGQVMQAGRALSEMLRLEKAIDSLSAKKPLTAKDSVTLEKTLDRFQQLNRQFSTRK